MRINYITANSKMIIWISILLIVFLVSVWTFFFSPNFLVIGELSISQYLFVFLTVGLQSFTMSKFLATRSPRSKKQLRMAFIGVIGFNIILMLLFIIIRSGTWHWPLFFLTIFASFVGSFVASNCDHGWWENNAAPSSMIEKEVLNQHHLYLDHGSKPNLIKRTVDIIFSLISLILSLPIILIIIPIIWWEDPGPVLFVKNSVGKGGINFKQFKFRSMILDAEKSTGPISGYEHDDRVLFIGEFLRKTALDELPQLLNILFGQMSYVGPRPQRTVLVHGYLQRLPEFAKRHQVRPGLAGLAQVVDAYDISPEEKLAWDLVYIEQANIWLDLKLVLSAFYLVFALRWLPNTHPELKIRKLLKMKKPQA